MAKSVPLNFRPPLIPFTVPMVAGFAAFFGLFVGLANGAGFTGLIAGLVFGAIFAYLLGSTNQSKKICVMAGLIVAGAIGFFYGGFSGLALGGLLGAIIGRATWWFHSGEYRATLPPYSSGLQVWWHHTFRLAICGFIFFFLIAPILVIIPLAFNAQDFFTFTKEMLALDPAGYSLKHFNDFFTDSGWQAAMWNSFKIAPMATIMATAFGTLAAIGLSQPHVPFRGTIMAILISPMIVPLIISATGMFFFYAKPFGYSELGFLQTYWAVVLAHAALGIPFVIITVTATLVGFDRSLTRAAENLGANPVVTFFKIQMPLIIPGVVSGALFAFITSFDEVVVVIFLGSPAQKTLPWQMFIGLREQISPTILAVATLMVVLSIMLLTVLELLRRRSERLRGLTPS